MRRRHKPRPLRKGQRPALEDFVGEMTGLVQGRAFMTDPNRPVQAQTAWADAMAGVLETVRREVGSFPGLATDPAPEAAPEGAKTSNKE